MPRWTLKFSPGNDFDHFSSGNNRKTIIQWNFTMTADVEHVTRDPRWHNFLRGISQLGLFFTGVKASGERSRDVIVLAKSYESYTSILNQ